MRGGDSSMKGITRKRIFVLAFGIIGLLVIGSVSGWFVPRLRNPSGTYVGYSPEWGFYYTFVFIADRHVAPRRMTMLVYWNTYAPFSNRIQSRTLYTAEVVKAWGDEWKYRMLGYQRGPHDPENLWTANEIVWLIDDFGTIEFSDDYQEVTMFGHQNWFKGQAYGPDVDQDVDPRDGFPDGGAPLAGYWPANLTAKRISVTK
jgi:hypothetical protein